MSVNEKMTAIADAIREKTGGTETLTLDEMAQAIRSITASSLNTTDATAADIQAEKAITDTLAV